MTKPDPVVHLIRHEADLIKAGSHLQGQGLDLLIAEMRALATILPGLAGPHHSGPHQTDAETEEGFDNMPV